MKRKPLDLFAAQREVGRKYGRRKRRRTRGAAMRSYRDNLPWGKRSPHGSAYVSLPELEALYVAVLGESWGELGDRLKEAIGEELGKGRMALRVYAMRSEVSPVSGALHLNGQDSQRVRSLLNGRRSADGEELPFNVTVFRRPADPLHHARLSFERGIRMDSPTRTHRATSWPSVPLVVGASTAEASWEHLRKPGALAVWHGTRMWLLRQVEGHFPTLLESLGLPGLRSRSPFTDHNGGTQR